VVDDVPGASEEARAALADLEYTVESSLYLDAVYLVDVVEQRLFRAEDGVCEVTRQVDECVVRVRRRLLGGTERAEFLDEFFGIRRRTRGTFPVRVLEEVRRVTDTEQESFVQDRARSPASRRPSRRRVRGCGRRSLRASVRHR